MFLNNIGFVPLKDCCHDTKPEFSAYMKSKVPSFNLWIEVEIGDKDQPANQLTENFCNVVVECEDGRRYALNVWTFDFLPLARYPWPHSTGLGEPANYLLPPDLFVERLDRETIEQAISQLFQDGEMKEGWLSLREND
jgi:hypothetical protein